MVERMGLAAVAFWFFALAAVGAAAAVVLARNPVHAVLFLILSFVSAAGLFVLLGAEFLAMLLVVVYVGAVAVLFLFVVMMLDIDFEGLKRGFLRYAPLGALVALILLSQFVLIAATWRAPAGAARAPAASGENALALGRVIYTDFLLAFQLSGLVLFVAMVGAVVLTLRRREGVRRQDVGAQVGRRRKQAVALLDPKPGRGLD